MLSKSAGFFCFFLYGADVLERHLLPSLPDGPVLLRAHCCARLVKVDRQCVLHAGNSTYENHARIAFSPDDSWLPAVVYLASWHVRPGTILFELHYTVTGEFPA